MAKRTEDSIRRANRGIDRNKRPLSNLEIKIEVHEKLSPSTNLEELAQYKFKDKGYMVMYSRHQKSSYGWSWNGFVTAERVKEVIGEKQWAKFCQGKRLFIIQRRIDGKNIPKDGSKEE